MSCKDQASSTSLHSKKFSVIEEINIKMVGITGDGSNGYKCYSFLNDVTNESNLKRTSSDFMNERRNEEGNNKQQEECNEEGNERRNSHILAKGRYSQHSVECDLLDDGGIFIANGHVITYDAKEVVLNNQLNEDHVGVSIFYCPSNVSMVMTIWK